MIKVGSQQISEKKDDYPVKATVRVRFAETDAQGIVYNGEYFTYLEVARIEFFRSIGVLDKLLKEKKYEAVVAEAACRFKKPAFFDDVIDIYTRVNEVGRSSIIFHYALFERSRDELLTAGYTVIVFLDPETRKPKKIDENLKRCLLEAKPVK